MSSAKFNWVNLTIRSNTVPAYGLHWTPKVPLVCAFASQIFACDWHVTHLGGENPPIALKGGNK